jgi:hypothetical protein
MEDLTHLTAFAIDRLVAGLSDDVTTAAAKTHTESCASCADRLATARADQDAFLSRNPPALRAELLHAARTRRRWRWALTLVPLPAAVALFVWLRPPAPHLAVQSSGAQIAVQTAGAARSIDVRPAGYRHVALYASGETTFRLLVDLDLDRDLTIPLEARRGEDAVIAVFSAEPVDEARVHRAVRTARNQDSTLQRPIVLDVPFAEVRTAVLPSHRSRLERP